MSHGRWAKHQNDGIMTFSEIGERLGITQSTAQYLYERGMKKLRRFGRCNVFSEFEQVVRDCRTCIDRRESMKRIFQDEPLGVE